MAVRGRADPGGVIGQIARIREQANRYVEGELAARAIGGVLPAHGAVFACLYRAGGPVPIKELVASVGRVKSTVTGVLHNLERSGYIAREIDPGDRRSSLISLTPRGRALRGDFEAISSGLQERLYRDMPPGDRQRLVDLLSRLEANLAGAEHAEE